MMSLLAAKKTLAQQLRREPTAQEWALQVEVSQTELSETWTLGQQAIPLLSNWGETLIFRRLKPPKFLEFS